MKNNKELVKDILVVILEELNGYTPEEAKEAAKGNNGEIENKILGILDLNFPDNQ